jgi:hypothetical protein
MHPIEDLFFWKVFHIYYKLICILYALLCGQNFILVKSGCYNEVSPSPDSMKIAPKVPKPLSAGGANDSPSQAKAPDLLGAKKSAIAASGSTSAESRKRKMAPPSPQSHELGTAGGPLAQATLLHPVLSPRRRYSRGLPTPWQKTWTSSKRGSTLGGS